MAWAGGYDGTMFTRQSVKEYIDDSDIGWVQFLVLHNTAVPNMEQAEATRGGESQRMKNSGEFYKNSKGWPGGPHFWVFNNGKIGKGTPLSAGPGVGIHSPSWNRVSIGVEMVGDFDGTDDPKSPKGAVVVDTTAYLFACLLQHLGLPANGDTIRLHKEDPKTTHDCPGKLIIKDEFVKAVQGYMGEGTASDVTPVMDVAREVAWVNTPGDTLNFRDSPGGYIKGAVPDGTRVLIEQYHNAWADIVTPAGYRGWVFSKFLSSEPIDRDAPLPPGTFQASPVAYAWLKRVEGKMLSAYWDSIAWAIGYGHNGSSGIPPIPYKGMTINDQQANAMLVKDVALQERYLNALVKVPLTQAQVDALIVHIYQQGPGRFRDGPVLPIVNAGKHDMAADAIEALPSISSGQKRRRAVEARIYRGENPERW